MGTCFYDLLHPKDVQKVKEQLACFDLEEGMSVCLSVYMCVCVCYSYSNDTSGLSLLFSSQSQCQTERQQL